MEINPSQSKYNYLLEKNKDYMNMVALSFGKRKITYEEMHDRILKYAKMLYSRGIREGDIIGICALNTPESVYLLYALDLIGAVVVGFSPFDNKNKIKDDIELIQPKMIISVDMSYSNFKDYEKALNFSTLIYPLMRSVDDFTVRLGYGVFKVLKGNFTFNKNNDIVKLLKNIPYDITIPSHIFKEQQLGDIMFTGGSTGVHKGAELPEEGFNYVVEGMNSLFKAEPGMIHLGNIPFGHMAYGRSILHFSLSNNMEFALTLKALPRDFYDEIVRTHATAAVGGPPHWVSLIEKSGDIFVPSHKLVKGSLSELHYATSGGEAKKSATDKAINEALRYCGSDAILGDGLGATETCASITINNGKIHTFGTVGKSLSTIDIKLVNPKTGCRVKKGERGLLYVSGPSTLLGYHNNPKETDKVISYDETGKKWVNIGDYLVETENNEYIYAGRQKRNFVSGCDNIYPETLESLLIEIPEIREVVVTPIPDELVQFVPRFHISLYDTNIDYKKLEEKIKKLILSNFNLNWLPGSIVYYSEPLVRMTNSKLDISYYKKQDEIAMQNNEINNTEAIEVRIKKI